MVEGNKSSDFADNGEIVVPKVGMVFDDVDDVYELYRRYAIKTGFACKIRSSKKESQSGILRYRSFSCSREGKHVSESNTPLDLNPTGKCGCNAKVTVLLDLDGKWKITRFVSEHNHLTSPSKSRFMRNNKLINKRAKRKILQHDKAGIRMCKNFNIQAVDAGGRENLEYDEKDARNMVAKENKLKLKDGDATALQSYFTRMQNRNIDFFQSIDLDGDNRLRNVFWADARCREAYKEFGEVVTFDTTYLTNKYDMPFAPFVGVNHHGQSILFGCGLLANEETETFVWLFETWLTCMGGRAPQAIITDQDSGMKNAVERVFPEAKHRWCLWHIMKKIPEKLRRYTNYVNIKCRLKKAVYDTLCPAEFEQAWGEMLEKYKNLKQNRWLSKLYVQKHRWVPCYLNTTFWAGMSTTQRSESMNAFFDGYVHSKTSLKQFVEKYDDALKYKMEKELKEDARAFTKVVPTSTYYEVEEQIRDIYTINKFKVFQKEVTKKMYCEIIGVEDETQDETLVKRYVVQEEIWYKRKPLKIGDDGLLESEEDDSEVEDAFKTERVRKLVVFKVWFQEEGRKIECICRRFEMRGIVCRHALCVLHRNNVMVLPKRYILRRWRKDVQLAHTKVPITSDSWELTPSQMRCKKLCDHFEELADAASINDEKCVYIDKWIGEQLKVVKTMNLNVAGEIVISETDQVIKIGDPHEVKRKGAPLKNRKEEKTYTKKTKKTKNNQKENTEQLTRLHKDGHLAPPPYGQSQLPLYGQSQFSLHEQVMMPSYGQSQISSQNFLYGHSQMPLNTTSFMNSQMTVNTTYM